jgi:hypothetical protein
VLQAGFVIFQLNLLGSYWRCPKSCPVVVPSGACLVASSPDAPGASEGLAYGRREHPARLGHGHADQAHVLGRLSPGRTGSFPVSCQCSGWSVAAREVCGPVAVPGPAATQGVSVNANVFGTFTP